MNVVGASSSKSTKVVDVCSDDEDEAPYKFQQLWNENHDVGTPDIDNSTSRAKTHTSTRGNNISGKDDCK